jgi:hypothetical protein
VTGIARAVGFAAGGSARKWLEFGGKCWFLAHLLVSFGEAFSRRWIGIALIPFALRSEFGRNFPGLFCKL